MNRPTASDRTRPLYQATALSACGKTDSRRIAGAAGQPLTRQDPVGNWTIQLENTDELTASFPVGFIHDIVLVFTVAAATPAWP